MPEMERRVSNARAEWMYTKNIKANHQRILFGGFLSLKVLFSASPEQASLLSIVETHVRQQHAWPPHIIYR